MWVKSQFFEFDAFSSWNQWCGWNLKSKIEEGVRHTDIDTPHSPHSNILIRRLALAIHSLSLVSTNIGGVEYTILRSPTPTTLQSPHTNDFGYKKSFQFWVVILYIWFYSIYPIYSCTARRTAVVRIPSSRIGSQCCHMGRDELLRKNFYLWSCFLIFSTLLTMVPFLWNNCSDSVDFFFVQAETFCLTQPPAPAPTSLN